MAAGARGREAVQEGRDSQLSHPDWVGEAGAMQTYLAV